MCALHMPHPWRETTVADIIPWPQISGLLGVQREDAYIAAYSLAANGQFPSCPLPSRHPSASFFSLFIFCFFSAFSSGRPPARAHARSRRSLPESTGLTARRIPAGEGAEAHCADPSARAEICRSHGRRQRQILRRVPRQRRRTQQLLELDHRRRKTHRSLAQGRSVLRGKFAYQDLIEETS